MLCTSLKISRFLKLSGVFAFAVFVILSSLSVVAFADTYQLVSGRDHAVVGRVEVNYKNSNLYVDIITNSGYAMQLTHLDIEGKLSDIPQKNGNPIPGQFHYSKSYNSPVTISSYKIPMPLTGVCLFIAAHAEVCKANVVVDTYTMFNFSDIGQFMYEPNKVSYFGVWLKTGIAPNFIYTKYVAFCAQPHINFGGYYQLLDSVLTSSYKSGIIPNQGPINYLINNYMGVYEDPTILNVVIWRLLGYPIATSPEAEPLVAAAYNDAITHISYIPPVGGVYAVYASASSMGEILQPALLLFKVPTKIAYGNCETAWGGTKNFSGSNWALYFTYKIK